MLPRLAWVGSPPCRHRSLGRPHGVGRRVGARRGRDLSPPHGAHGNLLHAGQQLHRLARVHVHPLRTCMGGQSDLRSASRGGPQCDTKHGERAWRCTATPLSPLHLRRAGRDDKGRVAPRLARPPRGASRRSRIAAPHGLARQRGGQRRRSRRRLPRVWTDSSSNEWAQCASWQWRTGPQQQQHARCAPSSQHAPWQELGRGSATCAPGTAARRAC